MRWQLAGREFSVHDVMADPGRLGGQPLVRDHALPFRVRPQRHHQADPDVWCVLSDKLERRLDVRIVRAHDHLIDPATEGVTVHRQGQLDVRELLLDHPDALALGLAGHLVGHMHRQRGGLEDVEALGDFHEAGIMRHQGAQVLGLSLFGRRPMPRVVRLHGSGEVLDCDHHGRRILLPENLVSKQGHDIEPLERSSLQPRVVQVVPVDVDDRSCQKRFLEMKKPPEGGFPALSEAN